MKQSPLTSLLHRLRQTFEAEGCALTDAELLQRWLDQRDQVTFETLVWRLGPLVLGVCRRLLRHPEEIDDAFQASFLILIRKAATIRGQSLSGWLYQVAYRVCLRLRNHRVQEREQPALGEPAVPLSDELLWRDLRPILDQEIGRLPERYRVAFVLCYLQGKTNGDAARELGCPVGTILSRLAWARERLRQRLTRRGVTLTVAALAAVLGQTLVEAAPPQELVSAAVRLPVGEVPAAVASLAKGVLQTMFVIRVKLATVAVVCSLGLLGAGVRLLSQSGVQVSSPEAVTFAAPMQPLSVPVPAKTRCEVPSERDGILVLIGTEIKEGEKVPPGQVVKVRIAGEEKRFRRLGVDDRVKKDQLLARLDDRLARDEVEIRQSKADGAEAERTAAETTRDEVKKRLDGTIKLAQNKVVSADEVSAAELTWKRYVQEEIAKRAAVRQAQVELKSAKTILSMHEIRSPGTGVIRKIYKQRGEGVKTLEPIMQIELDDE